jgi:hypothetical protein
MIHFKPRSKRVFILGTVKPAHLINYIIPAKALTRGKPLFTCFRAHVPASTRCLLSKEAHFQQPFRNGPQSSANPSHIMSDYFFSSILYILCHYYFIKCHNYFTFFFRVLGLWCHVMSNFRKHQLFQLFQYYYIIFFHLCYFNYIN